MPTLNLPDLKLASYPEQPLLPGNVMMYPNQTSSAGSYSGIFIGSSPSYHNHVEVPSAGVRNEVVYIPPTGDVSMQSVGLQLKNATGAPTGNFVTGNPQIVPRTQLGILDAEQNLLPQRLSLSLSTQIPSTVPLASFQYQYVNPGLSSLFGSHVSSSAERTISCEGDESSQAKEFRNDEYLPSSFPGTDQSAVKTEALCNPRYSEIPKVTGADQCLYESFGPANTVLNSKFLKSVQQLLDEVVNVRKTLKQQEFDKHHKFHGIGLNGSKENDERSNNRTILSSPIGNSSDPNGLVTNSSCKLSPTERQDLEHKKAKLLSMLDEVDKRYKQYYDQTQIVGSFFDMLAGFGAAKTYMALALQRISCHFRCLRDAISGQIRITCRNLGEQDTSPNGLGGGMSRLGYVDQQLRQQRALQQFGGMRHAWRPQRGLPESSVSILRTWLFEHFLHPYPKDSEKIMLARQTGLTRSQVANWFINARVRLWKPMVEEIYKEEIGDSEIKSKSSPESPPKEPRDDSWASEDKGEELQETMTSTAAAGGHLGQSHNMTSDFMRDVEMNGPTARMSFQKGAHGDVDTDCGIMKLQGDQSSNMDDHSLYLDEFVPTNQNGDGSLMAATYHISELSDLGVGSQVSLALGLRHCESDVPSISGGPLIRGGDIAASVGPDTAEYNCMDSGNQRHRFGKPHLIHDFVV